MSTCRDPSTCQVVQRAWKHSDFIQKQLNLANQTIKSQEQIIKGLSQAFESRYQKLKPNFRQSEQFIIDFFRTKKGEWVFRRDAESSIMKKHSFISNTTIERSCRKLREKGILLVKYEKPHRHPKYTLNLRYGEDR